MLARSTTCASKRSYGSQSFHSEHTPSAKNQRSRSSPNTPSIHVQAEAAASEAFRRAQIAEPYTMSIRSSQSRKDSHLSSEGSHLADARLGRRRSTAARESKKRAHTGHPTLHLVSSTASSATGPSSATDKHIVRHESATHKPATAARSKPIRRALSTTANGSPTPRRKIIQTDVQPVPIVTSHFQDFSYDGDPSSEVLDLTPTANKTTFVCFTPQASVLAKPSDEDVSLARDRCLQDFHQHKLRERRSIFFGSLQKLRSRQSDLQRPAFVQDHTIPPYNQTDGHLTFPPDTVFDDVPTTSAVCARKDKPKALAFSTSLKSRFRKILRKKSSHIPMTVPPQHVEAKRLHQSVTGDYLASVGSRQYRERSTQVVGAVSPPRSMGTAAGGESQLQQDGEASRVTSWTNSTAGRTHSAMSGAESAHRLRQRASFFGRSVQNKLRKASRSNLQSSPQSQGLFTALQDLIHTTVSSRQASHASEVSRTSALPTLPSQQRCESASSSHRHAFIRTVTPEDMQQDFRAMSPLEEVVSPCREETKYTVKTQELSQEVHIVRPSPQQIAGRVERTQNRWHASVAPVEGLTTNPYQLTPLTHSYQQSSPTDNTSLPQHVRIARPMPSIQAFSPSIYSQATASRTATPEGHIATVVKITGREVKRYAISPNKSQSKCIDEHPAKVSSEWRRWLSGETKGFSALEHTDDTPESYTLSGAALVLNSTRTDSSTSAGCVTLQSQRRRDSGTPSAEFSTRLKRGSGPRPSSRQSSHMNDRYPMLDSSRNSSEPSIQSRPADSRRGSAPKHNATETPSSDQVDIRPMSIGDLVSGLRSQSALVDVENKMSGAANHGAEDDAATETIKNKTRSTVELRARFKSCFSDNAKQISIRRKTIINPVSFSTDETLQNIAAGPYAIATANAVVRRQENTMPAVEHDKLPALSSSEWLAGPVTRHYKSGQAARVGVEVAARGGSQGQRLATGWLAGR